MAEVALACGRAVRLNVVPEVVVGKLKNAREEGENSSVDRLGQVVAESLNFVHKGVQARGNAVDIRPLPGVPVELLNTIGVSTVALQVCLVK